MALMESQWKALIVSDLGIDLAATPTYNDTIALYWEAHEGYGTSDLMRLRYLHTKRDTILFLKGQNYYKALDYSLEGASESVSQRMDHLDAMLKDTDAQIKMEQSKRRGRRVPVVGELEAVVPISAEGLEPDPNARRYRGDPLKRTY